MAADTADIDIDELAAAVVDRLDGGQRIGDKLVLSRRQAIALAGGGLSLAALGIGTGEVAAADGTTDESVGAVGAQGDSVDVYLDQLLDDSGDEVLNIDDTGTANATARGWEFDSISTEELGTNIETPTDVSASRSYNTEEQNNNPHNIFVAVVVESDGTEAINQRLQIGNASGSLTRVDGKVVSSGDISNTTRVTFGPVEVPPGGYYQLSAVTTEPSIFRWLEWGRT